MGRIARVRVCVLKGQCVKFSKFNHRFNGSNGLDLAKMRAGAVGLRERTLKSRLPGVYLETHES